MNFPPEPVNEDGWTIWIEPLPGYILQCCDCGLKHELEFRIEEGTIQFRAKVIEETWYG
jgi:hypothetical protein